MITVMVTISFNLEGYIFLDHEWSVHESLIFIHEPEMDKNFYIGILKESKKKKIVNFNKERDNASLVLKD